VTLSARIYGFGSAFSENARANDVDLLIVHERVDPASCKFAITCKRRLAAIIIRAHITMLSAREEKHCEFLKTAEALFLGTVRIDQIEHDLEAVSATLSVLIGSETLIQSPTNPSTSPAHHSAISTR
jgi:hypothetical protein